MLRKSAGVLAAVVAALNVAGCVTPDGSSPARSGTSSALSGRELSPDEKKIIADAVGRVIKEPSSAKFRWAKFPANAGTGDVNYCASVNAKSALPGYGGNQLYIAVVGTENGRVKSAVVGAIHGGSDVHVVRTLCKRYGLDPDGAV
jgi:outer membrane lipoprotein SlyB